MQKTVDVCDTCEDVRKPVKKYTISSEGERVTKVLCAQHGRSLEVILGNQKPTGRPPAKKAASRKTTVSEIESRKARKG